MNTTDTHQVTTDSVEDRRTPERQWDALKPYAWASCSCGWRTETVETWDEAFALGDAHLVEVAR